jgi:hypothetical protein
VCVHHPPQAGATAQQVERFEATLSALVYQHAADLPALVRFVRSFVRDAFIHDTVRMQLALRVIGCDH